MKNKFACIHAHFYQPPRENPWLEQVEIQDSAYPYHDWNQKITSECYSPNTHSRILDEKGRVIDIANNYSKISFNFGPTLLEWLEKNSPQTYSSILDADRKSIERFNGHGSAIAQVYNHMILPLANSRDKYTQIAWGIADFKFRFGRKPEGMWLAETAVDIESLEMMAEHGISFTILSPYQAKRIRNKNSEWIDVSGGKVNTKVPYLVRLPSGRQITIFFYNGPVSQAVAFEGLLKNGEEFSKRLTSSFSDSDAPELNHIATDGESYGHHHRYGDMALAYAIRQIENNDYVRITNYAEFLSLFPPEMEAEIIENSSWSCVHGVERWYKDCGCNMGLHSGWNQKWREPLRQSMDWLRDSIRGRFEEQTNKYLYYCWSARDDYVNVILDRSLESITSFINRHKIRKLDKNEITKVLQLMELQRHAMLMFTSCGWFFDDISNIESIQCLQYAGRVLQLAKLALNLDLENEFMEKLSYAQSNIQEQGTGKEIYIRYVKPLIIDMIKVGAHFAINSLFEEYGDETDIFSYRVKSDLQKSLTAGKAKLVMGKINVSSIITLEEVELVYAACHLGGHTVSGGIRYFDSESRLEYTFKELERAFSIADFAEVIRVIDRHFGSSSYSIRTLFRDQQRRVLNIVMSTVLGELESAIGRLYKEHTPVMRFLNELKTPLPKVYRALAEFDRNMAFKRILNDEIINFDALDLILNEAKEYNLNLDTTELFHISKEALLRLFKEAFNNPKDVIVLDDILNLLWIITKLPEKGDLSEAQNLYFDIYYKIKDDIIKPLDSEEDDWLTPFKEIGKLLNIGLWD